MLCAQFPGPRNSANDMCYANVFHLRRKSWERQGTRGDPPNCGHWRRNLAAIEDADRKRLLVFGARRIRCALQMILMV